MTTSPTLAPRYDEAAVRALIESCGARHGDDPHGPQAMFDAPTVAPAELLESGALMLLADWGVVSVSGADAVRFLHAQTTNDIEGQPADQARWHGYCSPKGRLLAAGLLWRDADELRFAVSRPLAGPLQQRLAKFVLRAKARVEDRSNALAILGLTGRAAPAALRALGIEPPAAFGIASPAPVEAVPVDAVPVDAVPVDAVPVDAAPVDAGSVPLAIGLPPVDGFGGRWWLVVPVASLPAVWGTLSTLLQPLCSSWWRTGEVLAGEPRIVAATSERFVPQTLNWELIGGVSFRKGCYPGQEVVARMHYRGKPKRRTFCAWIHDWDADAAATTPAALAPGADLFAGAAPEPVGVVVSSAPAPDVGMLILYEAAIDVALRGGLRAADGLPLEPRELPYPVPFDEPSAHGADSHKENE